MEECLFCKLIKENGFKYVLKENEHCLAILAEYPFRKGNCTIILKRHVNSISELTENENASVFNLITSVSKAIESFFNAEKTYLLSVSDKVTHIHYHLIPKLEGQISMGQYCFIKLKEAEGNPSFTTIEFNEFNNGLKELIR